MSRLGWVLVGLGFLLQVLIPLGALRFSQVPIFGIPRPIMGIFLSSLVVVVGINMVYRYWYKEKTEKLDQG